MIRLYPEQLRAQLNEGLRAAYLLLGDDPLLLQESLDAVRHAAAAQGFDEHHTFQIDNSTDWNAIFSLCQAMSLFASRQTIQILLPENGPHARGFDRDAAEVFECVFLVPLSCRCRLSYAATNSQKRRKTRPGLPG